MEVLPGSSLPLGAQRVGQIQPATAPNYLGSVHLLAHRHSRALAFEVSSFALPENSWNIALSRLVHPHMDEAPTQTVVRNKADHRFELLDGDNVISYATFTEDGSVITVPLVFTPPEHRGQGFAARLMEGMLKLIDEAGEKVDPVCPYAAAYMKRNDSYARLLAGADRRTDP